MTLFIQDYDTEVVMFQTKDFNVVPNKGENLMMWVLHTSFLGQYSGLFLHRFQMPDKLPPHPCPPTTNTSSAASLEQLLTR